MAFKALAFALLACLPLLAQAAFSPEEIALRNAIIAPGATTFTLTKNIILTADLPPLQDGKVLTVRSRSGARFTINGANRFKVFRSAVEANVDLTLSRLVITGSVEAVNVGSQPSLIPLTKVNIDTVTFDRNDRALTLYLVDGVIRNSQFTNHRKGAIVTRAEDAEPFNLNLFNCKFTSNKAEPSFGGGAIRVGRYSQITADNCLFSKNTADFSGGAVSVQRGYAKITRSTFDSNVARESGGGLSIINGGFNSAGAELQDVTFSKNVAQIRGGGAVYIGAGPEPAFAVFKKAIFRNNKALVTPGGAFLYNANSFIKFCNAQFIGNTGNGQASNGLVLGIDNSLATLPNEIIPLITVQPGANLTRSTAEAECRWIQSD